MSLSDTEILRKSSSTKENLGLLSVLEAIEEQSQISQRELARVTGLNLKKVNYCLHKLLEKGYIKFQKVRNNPDKRVYLYILTPPGIKAKSRLTYGFLKFTLGFYNKAEQKLRDCLRTLSDAGMTRVALFGASDIARILLDLTSLEDIQVVAVLDESPQIDQFHGVPLRPIQDIARVDYQVVLITSMDDIDTAEQRLRDLGVPDRQIWRLS